MRIAFISYEYPPDSSGGGIATYVAQAARMMANRGHQIEVFASSATRDGRYENDGIVEHWIRETNRRDFGVVAGHRFAARHGEAPFDVLEGPDYNADGRKAVQLVPGIPFVVKMHTPTQLIESLNNDGGLESKALFLGQSLKAVVKTAFKGRGLPPLFLGKSSLGFQWEKVEEDQARRADIVAPPCKDLCEYARGSWHIPASRLRLSPHPYTPTPKFLGLSPRPQGSTVGFVGRLERRKGIETLVHAIPKVLRAQPGARFHLIGASTPHFGSDRPYDEWIRSRLGADAESVTILGRVPLEDMANAYDKLDICVFPSLWENFPNVCLEAMSAGRAVIGSSAGGMAEMLEHGQAGMLVPPGEPSALAKAIITLLRNDEERVRLGEVARRRVLSCYNEQVIGAMMEDIYSEAIKAKLATRSSSDRG
jgi:glycogen(starch) synthase